MTAIYRIVWRTFEGRASVFEHTGPEDVLMWPIFYKEGHRECLISCSVEVLKKCKTGSGAVVKNPKKMLDRRAAQFYCDNAVITSALSATLLVSNAN